MRVGTTRCWPGGAGDDLLSGGPGADVFLFNAGHDTITDFSPGDDSLGFDPALWAGQTWDINDILATANPTAGGLTFTFDASTTLTLENIANTSQIENDIFIV